MVVCLLTMPGFVHASFEGKREFWYHVLDPDENKIGYYTYQIVPLENTSSDTTLIEAEIHFEIKKFTFTLFKYDYRDSVRLIDRRLDYYLIEENKNGDKRRVEARSDRGKLLIAIRDNSGNSTVSINGSDFDISMFHLRLPARVEAVDFKEEKLVKMLIPLEGKIKQYRYGASKREKVDWNGGSVDIVIVNSKAEDDETVSWIDPQGVTIYLKTKAYSLALTTKEKALATGTSPSSSWGQGFGQSMEISPNVDTK